MNVSKRYIADRTGQINLVFALTLPVLVGVTGLALETSNAVALRSNVQAAADSAALAAAARYNEGGVSVDDAKDYATRMFKASISHNVTRYSDLDIEPQIDFSDTTVDGAAAKLVTVSANVEHNLTNLISFLGGSKTQVGVKSGAIAGTTSTSTSTVNPASVALVLDKSGSMAFCSSTAASSSGTTTTTSGNTTTTITTQTDVTVPHPSGGSSTASIMTTTSVTNNSDGSTTTITETVTIYDNGGVKVETEERRESSNSRSTRTTTSYSSNGSNYYGNASTLASSCGGTKIDALKDAVGALLDKIQTEDPSENYVRIGAATYSSMLESTSNMTWGVSNVRALVNNLTASGGTDSSDAVKWGYQRLTDGTDASQHLIRNGGTPTRIMVFMTDGENNYTSADTSTKNWCDTAKDDGVEIYSIAFDAPVRGEDLLNYCATSADHYFDVQSAEGLLAAFESIGLAPSDGDPRNVRLVK